MTVKQLLEELSKERYDEKNLPVVITIEDVNAFHFVNLSFVRLDQKNNRVVLVGKEDPSE